jgi:hypothetical protein
MQAMRGIENSNEPDGLKKVVWERKSNDEAVAGLNDNVMWQGNHYRDLLCAGN